MHDTMENWSVERKEIVIEDEDVKHEEEEKVFRNTEAWFDGVIFSLVVLTGLSPARIWAQNPSLTENNRENGQISCLIRAGNSPVNTTKLKNPAEPCFRIMDVLLFLHLFDMFILNINYHSSHRSILHYLMQHPSAFPGSNQAISCLKLWLKFSLPFNLFSLYFQCYLVVEVVLFWLQVCYQIVDDKRDKTLH